MSVRERDVRMLRGRNVLVEYVETPRNSPFPHAILDFLLIFSRHISLPLSLRLVGGLMQWSERRWRDGLRVFCGLMRHSSRAKTISNTPPSPFFFFDLSLSLHRSCLSSTLSISLYASSLVSLSRSLFSC